MWRRLLCILDARGKLVGLSVPGRELRSGKERGRGAETLLRDWHRKGAFYACPDLHPPKIRTTGSSSPPFAALELPTDASNPYKAGVPCK